MNAPIRVAVTGAAGNIGYALTFRLACGSCYGPDQPIILQLLEITPAMKALEGLVMELNDAAFPTLHGVEISDEADVAFAGANQVFLVGARPRGPGMVRADLIKANGPIFIGQGKALNKAAGDLQAVVVGNPCNTNGLIASAYAGGVPSGRITAMTRLDQNRAISQLAAKAGVTPGAVTNMGIWGNHSGTMYPDWKHAKIHGASAASVIGDDAWLSETFTPTVKKRGAAIIAARGASSAASAASAAVDHMATLWNGTPEGEWASMAVPSDGSYGVPEGILYSFPVTVKERGSYEIVQGIEHDASGQAALKATADELLAEREAVADLLG